MPTFKLSRERDAWATIRGFVYQVDLTIERWLQLQANEGLDLECGEDIDIVTKAISTFAGDHSRLLEQVKHREENLTLRKPEAIESIASFCEHLSNNPQLTLTNRFITNAKVGKERPSPIPNRIPAIIAWENIRLGKVDRAEQLSAVGGIRSILKAARKPEGLNSQTWQIFQGFIQGVTDDELIRFIKRFEWSTSNIPAEDLGPQIQQRLISNFAIPQQQAMPVYQRLFLFVFKLLSIPGKKHLNNDDLRMQLSLPALTELDQELLSNIRSLFVELAARVTALEKIVDIQKQSIASLDSKVQSIVERSGVDVRVSYSLVPIQLDLPPIVPPVIPRRETVSFYSEVVKTKTWCALYGEVGCGKTYLARLIVESFPGEKAWIRLRGLSPSECANRLDDGLYALSNVQPLAYREEWYDQVCSSLPSETIIVLDDLPGIRIRDNFSEQLIIFAQACLANGIKLVSTSPYAFPKEFQERIADILNISDMPRFSDEDINDLLNVTGPPPAIDLEKFSTFIATITARHATLLMAVARFLKAKNWNIGNDELSDLLTGRYASEIDQQTESLLRDTIPDEDTRILLYRLNLIRGAFGENEIRLVSETTPEIVLPFEKVNQSVGLWIQRETEATFMLSPLLSRLGSRNIELRVQRQINGALGEAIIQKGVLVPLDVYNAIFYLNAAEEYDKLGVIILRALMALDEDDSIKEDWGISDLYSDVPLPAQMDLSLRLVIRSKQISVRGKYKKDINFLVQDLDELFEQSTDENASFIVSAALLAGPLRRSGDIDRSNRYLIKALKALPNAELEPGQKLESLMPIRPEALIWATATEVRFPSDLLNWVGTLRELNSEQINAAFGSTLAEDGCVVVADRLWLEESKKRSGEQNWNEILAALEELTVTAKELGLELLWACSIRSKAIIWGEYIDDVPVAVALGTEALKLATADPRVQFILREAVGHQLAYKNRNAEALPWLTSALEQPTTAYSIHRHSVLLYASSAVGDSDKLLAIKYIEQAIQLANSSDAVPELALVKSLGELAVARWLEEDLDLVYRALEEGSEKLLICKSQETDWKQLFLIYSHITGYFYTLASTGTPPRTHPDGSPYDAPKRGIFLKDYSKAIDYYEESKVYKFASVMCMYAELMNDDATASKWALRALDIASISGENKASFLLAPQALQHLIIADRFTEALAIAIDLGALVVAATHSESSEQLFSDNFDIDSLFGKKPNDNWRQAEEKAVLSGVLPIMFRLGGIRLGDSKEGERGALDTASTCLEIAQTASDPDLWKSVGEIFKAVFVESASPSSLIEKGNGFDVNVLKALCYLGASLHSDPDLAMQLQLSILRYVFEELQSFRSLLRRVIVYFLERFWLISFTENRFNFTNHLRVTQELMVAMANECTATDKGKAILKAILIGLRYVPDKGIKDWLDRRI